MLVRDGLKGLPDAVETVWPRTVVHTCIVHLIRNSIRYVARQDWDKVAKDLKRVCTAPSAAAATERFLDFSEKWGTRYPAVIKLWSDAWRVCMALVSLDPTGEGRRRWAMRWKAPLNAFQVAFEGRLTPTTSN